MKSKKNETEFTSGNCYHPHHISETYTWLLKFLSRFFILKTSIRPTMLCSIDWDFEQLITCLFEMKWDWVIVLTSNLQYFYLNFLWQWFRHIWNLSKFLSIQQYPHCIDYLKDLETQEEGCKKQECLLIPQKDYETDYIPRWWEWSLEWNQK